MVFLEAETDPFTTIQQQQRRINASPAEGPSAGVRRPLRGLEVKEPTYSTMRIITADGDPIPFWDSGAVGDSPQSLTYTNYLINTLTFASTERMQLVVTFGDPYVFFFGDNPVQAQLNGALINSADFQWSSEMWLNYNEKLRGTKLAERGARLYLYYDGVLLEAYPTSFQPTATADNPMLIPFSMGLLVTSVQIVYEPTTDFPVRRQIIDPSTPEAYQQLLAKMMSEEKDYIQQSMDAQAIALNRAAYERGRTLQALDQSLGLLLEAAKNGVGAILFNPIRLTTVEAYMENDAAAGVPRPTLAASPFMNRVYPLRGKIWHNSDEYIVPPTLPPMERREPITMPDSEAAAASGIRNPPLGPGSSPEAAMADQPIVVPDDETEGQDIGRLVGGEAGGPPPFGDGALPGTIEELGAIL